MNRIEFPMVAAAIVTGATGAALTNRGCTTSRTGAGDYNITIEGGGVDSLECQVKVTPRGAAARMYNVVHTSDTVKQVLIFDAAGAAADADFEVIVWRIAIGVAV